MPSNISPLSSGTPPRLPPPATSQSLSEHLSNLGSKISRALSGERKDEPPLGLNEGQQAQQQDRSWHRGRDAFERGGLGNFRHSSTSRSPDNAVKELKEQSVPRGRGPVRTPPVADGSEELYEGKNLQGAALHSTGRGGVANITSLRSPSVESPRPHDRIAPEVEVVSIGRGGAGNIRSRSRSQVRAGVESHPHPPTSNLISTGRGGSGNIRSRSQSKARTDEVNPHSSVSHIKSDGNGVIDENGFDVPVRDAHPQKHGIEDLLHKVVHPGEHSS